MALSARVEHEGSTLRVALSGELDAHTVSAVADTVDPVLASGSLVSVVFDASELSFMDSAGLSELLRIQRLLAAQGGSIRMEGAGPTVRRVLEITGLLETLGVD
jgi:stage II sporulation protein AA (anti-sigma F factor antagonist)